MPSPPPAGYNNQNIGNYPSPIGNSNGFNGHGDGYRSPPPPAGFNGNNAYQQPRSPAPPYVDQSSNRLFGPDGFQNPHEKPIGGAPIVYGMQNRMDMPVIGTPPAERRICGIRRKYFWIILIIVFLILLVGLGAGLGYAFGKKKNGSGDSQADQIAAGAGTSTSGATTTSASSTSAGGLVVHTVPPAFTTPEVNTPTSEFTTPEPTTPPEESTPTPEPTTPDSTTPEPTTTPEPVTPPPVSTPDPITTTPPPPPVSTPDLITTTPPDIITTPDPGPISTPDPVTQPPTPTAFALEDGYNTLTLAVGSTSGNLCPYIATAIQATTTVYVSISGDESDPYTAVWKLDNYPATLTATGVPQKTGGFDAWGFEAPINSNVNGCSWQGGDVFALAEGGIAGYAS
ncbi:hypothetical protein AA313_de0205240 [Arthrobotrys entomopaga]|nr:hypothetical protein AA313_de0205240 [Arthrobotrys entomopaga]